MTDYNNDDRRNSGTDVPQVMRNIFGIFMILVYVGVGIAMFFNVFQFKESFNTVRYIGGVMLILYGFWRGYRQFKGMD